MFFFKKKPLSRIDFIERTYTDKPGSYSISFDDLRYETVEFERSIFDYLMSKGSPSPGKSETLNMAIQNRLPNFPLYPQLPKLWPDFLVEADELRRFRNQIIHSNYVDLPPVTELYERFKSANKLLYPFRIHARKDERFSFPSQSGGMMTITIDNRPYVLSPADVSNLLLELHPASRGKQNYVKGRVVEAKVLGYDVEKFTYFIEGEPPFDLDQDEAATLEDLVTSWIGQKCYSSSS